MTWFRCGAIVVRMSTKPRQTISFTKPHKAWLQEKAQEKDVSVSEVLRQIIDKAMEEERR